MVSIRDEASGLPKVSNLLQKHLRCGMPRSEVPVIIIAAHTEQLMYVRNRCGNPADFLEVLLRLRHRVGCQRQMLA